MDQELKQRLIGAAVITALAAIFVPMLFDDPIDESGKSISELKIPELPAKSQDVEIMPLPEKTEDIPMPAPEVRPPAPMAAAKEHEMDDEAAMEAPQPRNTVAEKETVVAPPPAKWVEPEEDVVPPTAPVSTPKPEKPQVVAAKPKAPVEKPKPAKEQVKPEPVKEANVKVPKPVAVGAEPPAKPASTETVSKSVSVEPAAKPAAAETATVRWYLNAGSFSQKANAASFQETLKKQGFASSIKEVAAPGGTVFKVRIGPMLDKVKAQAVKAKLAQINVNSFIAADE